MQAVCRLQDIPSCNRRTLYSPRMKLFLSGFVLCAMSSASMAAQTVSTVLSFNGSDGQHPQGALVEALDGNLYGTTYGSLAGYGGSIFKLTPSGTLTTLYTFCSAGPPCTNGASPQAGLFLASNGVFYGTTTAGGSYNSSCPQGCGTIFKVTGGGALTVLHTFCTVTPCVDGQEPIAGLVEASNGGLYGTTYLGGANSAGTIFRITTGGKFASLYSFCSLSACADGEFPAAGLVQASNGELYGTTYLGGSFSEGTVFQVTTTGVLTTVYNFCQESGCTDGAEPETGLVQGTDGNLYGTTSSGGATTSTEGTIYKVTTSGALSTLYSFCSKTNCTDGYVPAGLIQATNGDFYGTTTYGGGENGNFSCNEGSCGTIFEITPSGAFSTLYSFCTLANCADGWQPYSGLVEDTNGTLYGTTNLGGADGNWGTVFSLSVGLGPFVEARPSFGKPGAAIKILGTGLTGSTKVTFNGVAAFFEVLSSSEILTKVPSTATTGTLQVVTPSGTVSGNVPFVVEP